MTRQIFIGPLIHTNENEELIIKERVAVYIDGGKFMTPGFIDCHTHANQFPNLGLGYNKPLLGWLETYTYPLEKKFIDTKYAETVFEAVVKRTIEMGTTTACYFASLYTKASVILAKKTVELGQRAFIGKVNMSTPRDDEYYESVQESIKNTQAFIESIEQIKNPLVKPIVTPRFALSCDMELMKKLAEIAKDKDLHIQTHISENEDEVEKVKQTFSNTYAAVYNSAGLLTRKTILAHGIYLDDSELALLKKKGTAVIHCPSSNTNLKSGLCDVQKLKTEGITVGLGTDVSGGASYSMLNEMRSALQVSNSIFFMKKKEKEKYTPLNYKQVFYMATLGGAEALSIDNEVGNLTKGKQFDALIIEMDAKDNLLNNLKIFDKLKEDFQRFIYTGDDRNIVSVYVNGNKVK
ncbi:PREDICTED: guanine deaminase-like isoform X2 [Wasmannia auropunctata]|uniref:guanine deaminase-like isoform X2 n=1 Tax=Wasmannia auropunctata TaxID=64793 RepID=UPI0005EF8415|nr:PREDICTED: guanine deaminase-like isoform X2 [Wasmannia auropunctata]